MAKIYNASSVQLINNYFEKFGYPVEFFENDTDATKIFVHESDWRFKDENRNSLYEDRYTKTAEKRLENFYVQPIVLKNNSGDEFEVYINMNYTDADGGNYSGNRALRSKSIHSNVDENGEPYNLEDGIKRLKDGEWFWTDYNRIAVKRIATAKLNTNDINLEELNVEGELDNFENFNSLDAPNYSVILGDNPQVSEASVRVDLESYSKSQLEKAEEKLKQEQKSLQESLIAKDNGTIKDAMWTFDEVDELYNSQITREDKRAYFIYLQNVSRKKLKGGFAEKYGSSYPAEAVDIIELMKRGALFFDPTAKMGFRLQPKVIYRSGNIWKKWGNLENNKEFYVQRFGEEIYKIHYDTLFSAWKEVHDKRLRCKTNDETMRLSMLPISRLAETIQIGSIINPHNKAKIKEEFRVYTSFQKGKRIEDVANLKGKSSINNLVTKQSVSLKDGFIEWLKLAGEGQRALDVGVQWSSMTDGLNPLVTYYLTKGRITNPYKKEKGGSDKFERRKDDARKTGIRLFQQFLNDGLTGNDAKKVDYIFNMAYNNYHEPVLEQVPIGFTYKKYIDNRGLFVLRQANLNALRYYMSRGSVGLAYGVGLGKTFCSIFVMKQALDLGLAEKPLVIVPNQVYTQFGQEIVRGLGADFDPKKPNTRLNMFYNGGGIYNELGNNAVNGINLCTYEATKLFAFQEQNLNNSDNSWLDKAMTILEMGSDDEGEVNLSIKKQRASEFRKSIFNIDDDTDISRPVEDDDNETDDLPEETTEIDDILGDLELETGGTIGDEVLTDGDEYSQDEYVDNQEDKNKSVIYLNIESTDFDFVCVDEAHNFNNLFTKVISQQKEIQTGGINKKSGKIGIQRETNPYSKIRETQGAGKEASAMAQKLFWITQYVQNKNKMGNTLLLSATPFTNSPIQLYSMLTFLNYSNLEDAELGIIKDFFDVFAKIEYAEDFKTDLTIVKRNKLIGWRNVIAMQKFVYRVFDKSSKEEEDKAVIRPNKITLPLKRILIEDKIYELPKENFVSTTIQLSNRQQEIWKRVRKYASNDEDRLRYEELCSDEWQNSTIFGKYTTTRKKVSDDDEAEIDIENADDIVDGTQEGEKAKDTAKAVQCLTWGRQICLNPMLFKCSGYQGKQTPKSFIEASPKLLYVMECIKSVKEFHANSKTSPYMSGQVIYMNFGTKAFTYVRDYIVEELGFNKNEVGIISGQGNYIGKKRYNSKQIVADAFLGRQYNKEKEEYEPLSNEKRIKVLIGSESIKEGINLQNYASVLYNTFLDFNPTDIVQTEGRIWRQGNEFANVRIVTPLMSDCIDVFMFQKLEDKTQRINQIWTKTGNANEIDTTSFDPSELKFELLTDPKAIATLEREYKKDKLEEQIQDTSQVLSSKLGLEAVWKDGEKVLYPQVNKRGDKSFYCQMYVNISMLRPDLITMPLWDKKAFLDFKTLVMTTYPMVQYEKMDKVNTPWDWVKYAYSILIGLDANEWFFWTDTSLPTYRDWIEKIFNYSADNLIELMVKVLKDKKIGYPRGYSKNWRDVIAPVLKAPIIEFDEVEYDTKKGTKKGVAVEVRNDDGATILIEFYRMISGAVQRIIMEIDNNNSVTADNNIYKRTQEFLINAIKKSKAKLTLENFENDKKFYFGADFRLENHEKLKDTLIEKTSQKEWEREKKAYQDQKQKQYEMAKLLKWWYENASDQVITDSKVINDVSSCFDETGNLKVEWTPYELDIQDTAVEDIMVQTKVKQIASDDEVKEVMPTKYPDPIVWGSKNFIKEVHEMILFQYKRKDYLKRKDVHLFANDFKWIQLDRDVSEQAIGTWAIKNLDTKMIYPLTTILVNNDYKNNTLFLRNSHILFEKLENQLPKTWIAFEDTMPLGLWSMASQQFYSNDTSQQRADFNKALKEKFNPQGITKLSDITTQIDALKIEINTFKQDINNLDDPQMFEELIQEVMRKQEKLNSEEIRAGMSYLNRAKTFAESNPDYLGNEMLNIFMNTPEEDLKDIQKQYRPSDRAIAEALKERMKKSVEVEVEEVEEAKEVSSVSTETLIEELKELMEFSDDKEASEIQLLIEDLEFTMELE